MPKEYIYEPWTAPLSIQTKAKCIVGKDYPLPGQMSKFIASRLFDYAIVKAQMIIYLQLGLNYG